MKKLDKRAFKEIQDWIHRNARPIELARWQYAFENGSKEAVLEALAVYQNADGGFGNALEPDGWNPDSSPYTTMYAMGIIQEIGWTDRNHPIIQGIFRFLESGVHCQDDQWIFCIPTNDQYPRAPWWTYSEETNRVESAGVTAQIAGFLLTYADKNSPLYQKALALTGDLLKRLETLEKHGEMGIMGYCGLLESIDKAGLKANYRYEEVLGIVRKLVFHSIERDSSKWMYYGVLPSNYIKTPNSIYYEENKDIVEQELTYVLETRPAGSVWGIPWSWFDLNEVYPKEFAISENWWRAAVALEKVKYLCQFGYDK